MMPVSTLGKADSRVRQASRSATAPDPSVAKLLMAAFPQGLSHARPADSDWRPTVVAAAAAVDAGRQRCGSRPVRGQSRWSDARSRRPKNTAAARHRRVHTPSHPVGVSAHRPRPERGSEISRSSVGSRQTVPPTALIERHADCSEAYALVGCAYRQLGRHQQADRRDEQARARGAGILVDVLAQAAADGQLGNPAYPWYWRLKVRPTGPRSFSRNLPP
jgi:hypothetical protein